MMTENEIISYLKKNKTKGVAFGFMPSEVKDWCIKHRFDRSLDEFDDDAWIVPDRALLCYSSDIYCLPEEYELNAQFKPDWVEFEIDKDGCFEFNGKRYYYREDSRFETENRDKFKGFGGWLFDDIWRLVLRVGDDDGFMMESYQPGMTVFPSIPVKIKFWRYKK